MYPRSIPDPSHDSSATTRRLSCMCLLGLCLLAPTYKAAVDRSQEIQQAVRAFFKSEQGQQCIVDAIVASPPDDMQKIRDDTLAELKNTNKKLGANIEAFKNSNITVNKTLARAERLALFCAVGLFCFVMVSIAQYMLYTREQP